ncbi:hypothetical protein BDP27DRAFT_1420152 [Rhodocollybia butyracea]|uniref:Uncharacterized protein n=1 Tax=Rhodocollybia butyracea TaxID=206335 RepID=A0A9P5PXG3_9AGAR|nr:hypothetical protein BDP27DRAFT_1420152 [Rhodocollybia butyracea]
MSSLYARYPTYDEPLPGNFASQSSDFTKALFGIILQWQKETGGSSVQQFMSCVEGTLKHHTSVNMGTAGERYFAALVVRRCGDCTGPDNDRLSVCESQRRAEGLIPRISRITELGRATDDYRHLKKKIHEAVALLNRNNAADGPPAKLNGRKRERDGVDQGRPDGVKQAKYTSRYMPQKVEEITVMCKEIEAVAMDPLMLNNEVTVALTELKEALNTFV